MKLSTVYYNLASGVLDVQVHIPAMVNGQYPLFLAGFTMFKNLQIHVKVAGKRGARMTQLKSYLTHFSVFQKE